MTPITEDRIIEKLLEMEAKMATIDQIERLDRRIYGIMDQLDKQTVILQRLDQERVFMADKLQLKLA